MYLIESLQFCLNINPLNHSLWTNCVHFTFNGFSGSFEAKSDILPKTCSSLSWCLSLWWLLSAACHNMHITVTQKPLLQPKLHPFINTKISYKEETLKDLQKWNGGQAEICEEIVPQKNLGLLQKGSLCLQTHSNTPLRSRRRRWSPKKLHPTIIISLYTFLSAQGSNPSAEATNKTSPTQVLIHNYSMQTNGFTTASEKQRNGNENREELFCTEKKNSRHIEEYLSMHTA